MKRAALAVLVVVSCGGPTTNAAAPPPAPSTTAIVTVVDAAPAAAVVDAGETTPDAGPGPSAELRPATDFTYVCYAGHSGGQDIFVAVKDEGESFVFGMADGIEGPFGVIKDEHDKGGDGLARHVIEGKTLAADKDYRANLQQMKLKPGDVTKITTWGLYIKGGWSLGVIVASNKSGQVIAKSAWGMQPFFDPRLGCK